MSFLAKMTVYVYCLRLHQLDVSTRLKVDQTCPVVYILAHILIQRSFKELNQSYTSMMDAICERLKGVVPSHGGTQQWAIISSYLLLCFSFWYQGPPSMATSSLGINGYYLIIQSPIEIWSLYPLFQFDYWGNGQQTPCTVMDSELWFLVWFKLKIK